MQRFSPRWCFQQWLQLPQHRDEEVKARRRGVEKKLVSLLATFLTRGNFPHGQFGAASAICSGDMATQSEEDHVRSLFRAIGKFCIAEEIYFDVVTGLSGSGPAYIFLSIEAMADGGVAAGLPRDLALALASQTVLGAATMVSQTGKHPGQLKDQATSPAGITIARIRELEKCAFRGTLINVVVAAAKQI
ncbi:pyrroline-5-carboxylate reductase-like [Phragmites australis]|uniref:pyrroline-5-carboxylate reductase-like n=1 Tax=Phragmites australis TaxID=29695 RepID=UPI002D771553|nr:pyrroline-5-carboxylate reductase-like [Phragmites australis]